MSTGTLPARRLRAAIVTRCRCSRVAVFSAIKSSEMWCPECWVDHLSAQQEFRRAQPADAQVTSGEAIRDRSRSACAMRNRMAERTLVGSEGDFSGLTSSAAKSGFASSRARATR
jgi:hypothetical protein